MALDVGSEILVTEHITKSFGGLTAVKDVDFSLREGEVRAIIGPNGAGKSTFFNLVAGTLKCDSGRIFFKGRDVTSLPAEKRVKLGIGRSFQIVNVCKGLSTADNVTIGAVGSLKKRTGPLETVDFNEARVRAQQLVRELGLGAYEDSLAGALVYGDQKKLEVVLALILGPDAVLLDEPAAGADEEGVMMMIGLIRHMAEHGKTVLFTDHDIEFVLGVADRVTVFDQGEIIAEGPPNEIATSELVRRAYLGVSEE